MGAALLCYLETEEIIVMNQIQMNNMNGVGMAVAPATDLEIKKEDENTSKGAFESNTSDTQKKQTKHVVTYIGNSEFIDATGHKWHNNDEHTYDDNEYTNRKDLHFMVKYGEMKHTVVTM